MSVKRVLLKLSGEALNGPNNVFPYDPETLLGVAKEIAVAKETGVEVAVVVGGGNIFRGADGASHGMDRTMADQFGMLATVQNGIVLLDLLERACSVKARLMTGLPMPKVAEDFIARRATRHLERGRVIILVGGTGNPLCTTDYAAALRASEIGATLIAKATNTDGVYDKDPRKHPDAQLLKTVSFARCIRDGLEVMDVEAFGLCQKQKMPIRIFSLREPGNITAVLKGAEIGSLVSDAA